MSEAPRDTARISNIQPRGSGTTCCFDYRWLDGSTVKLSAIFFAEQ